MEGCEQREEFCSTGMQSQKPEASPVFNSLVPSPQSWQRIAYNIRGLVHIPTALQGFTGIMHAAVGPYATPYILWWNTEGDPLP